jgi:hypothetical protein
MELGRCLHLVPVAGLVLAGALSLGGSPLLAAGPEAWVPTTCGSGGAPPGEGGAWYRLDPVLDATGTLAGMRLLAGGAEGPGRALILEPEAFASGPVQGRVIAGEDDGARSVLRALDPESGCATTVATVRDAVVRSAVATADGNALYEHRVDRRTREDLGVWRRELAGWQTLGQARRVLAPLRADAAYGPTFTTGLAVAPGGDVVVSSCAELACRTRVLAPDGRVATFAPTGPALGVVDGILVAREVCRGLPCPIVAHERDGAQRVLVPDARLAALGGATGETVVVETAGGRLRAVDVRSGAAHALDVDDVLPVGGGSLATSGASSAPGEVLLAPGGRVAGNSNVRRFLPTAEEVAP